MKSFGIKQFLSGTVLAVALFFGAIALALGSSGIAVHAASSPCIVLSSDPAQLYKTDPYQEFTVTARMEGVASVPNGGMYAAAVRITPDQADLLDFVEFVPSKDILQSALLAKSQHAEGVNVLMEGGNNGISAVTEDFNVGGFKFKLKSSVTAIPESLSFHYESVDSADWYGDKVEMADGTFTLNFSEKAPAIPVTKPTASASTTSGYSGSPVDFTPSGMADLVSAGKVQLFSVSESGAETPATIDAFKPTNVGSYKVVARPAEGFCWEDGDTSDAEFTFSVNKAVLTAAPGAEGELPTFTSESYKGSLDDIIEFKYYSDAACTQEIAKSALAPGEKYYVKPVLKDGADGNFEFAADGVTQGFLSGGTEYVEPAQSEPGGFGDILGLPWWVWIIIAAAVLLLLILIIVLIVKRRKRKDDDVRQVRDEIAASAATSVQPQHAQPIIMAQPERAADAQTVAKTDKIEDRMREMEHEAHEREITRYREEAARAERMAGQKESTIVQQPVVHPTVSAAESAAQERVKELEARMREMEHEAHEREITRYKEEAERMEKRAEQKEAPVVQPQPVVAAPVQPISRSAGESAAQKRVEELEARMRVMEREAHERELARYKEEAEIARKEAEEARKAQQIAAQQPVVQPQQSVSPQPVVPVAPQNAEDKERVKELEARVREMEREAHERELARYKEEAERARKEAEEARRTQQPILPSSSLEERMREMEREAHEREITRYKEKSEETEKRAQLPFMGQQYGGMHYPFQASADLAAQERVKEIEARLREMEREVHEREYARYRDETDRAKKEAEELARKSKQQDDELYRLRELQEQERRSKELMAMMQRPVPEKQQSDEMDRLRALEDQLQKQNLELQAMTEILLKRLSK